MSDKIQFKCPSCSKVLAVSVAHVGKAVKCPGCTTAIKVPAPKASPASPQAAVKPQTTAPAPRPAMQAQAPQAQAPQARAPQARPAQPKPTQAAMPGTVDFGSLPLPPTNQPNPFGDPFQPLGAPASSGGMQPGFGAQNNMQPGFGAPSGYGAPGGYGAAQPGYGAPQPGFGAGANPYTNTPTVATREPSKTTAGKSVGGLAAGAGVGFLAVILWLIIVAVSGFEFGILAWFMGAGIGFVAGLISKNSSPLYCAAAALVAVGSILSAKTIMALGVMVAHFGVNLVQDMMGGNDKYSHAYVDQQLANNQYSPEQKPYAIEFNAGYFEEYDDSSEMNYDNYDEEIESKLMKEIREKVKAATKEEKEAWVAGARQRHPTWFEDPNDRLAAVAVLKSQGALSPELQAHADYELSNYSNSAPESNYYENVSPQQMMQRAKELNLKAAELTRGKSRDELEQLKVDAFVANPDLDIVPDFFLATADNMNFEKAFQGPVSQHAEMYLGTEFDEDDMRYYEQSESPQFKANEKQFRAAIAERLRNSPKAARNAMIASTKSRHPDWTPMTEFEEEADVIAPDVLEDMGDGSFFGSFRTVFGFMDILWLVLGASSAFGACLKQART